MRALTAVTLTLSLMTGVAGAAGATLTNAGAVLPGTYAIEPTHTRVLFAVDHFGVSTWYGDFTHVSGTLRLDPRNPSASSVEVTLPVGSLSTTNSNLDDTLKGPDWFDAAKFPTMTFKSTKVTVTAPGQASIVGELTLHGVTRPVELEARFKGAAAPSAIIKAYLVGFDLRGHLRRSDFGISRYLGTISDNVDLIISAPFERRGD
jgi:polyisoprenoid-binding protein YceI